MSLVKLWDKITGKAKMEREYIERINSIYHDERKLLRHLAKLYPIDANISRSEYIGLLSPLGSISSLVENYIQEIIDGKRKQNPKMQYTEEELKGESK